MSRFSIVRRIFSVIVIIFLVVAGFWLFKIDLAESASSDNISGYAWSENIGWISFNCTNTGTCGDSNYGVNLNSVTTYFSGYAWAEGIGWIDFAPVGPYPTVPNYSAKYNLGNEKVTGWARALAYGDDWDGWILLGKESGGWLNQVTIDLETSEFHGWAWGGREVVGWISFNCEDTGICSSSNYAVIIGSSGLNRPPLANNLNLTNPDWCAEPPSYFFSWTYSDDDADPESRFDFQIDNNSDFSSPEIDRTLSDLSNPSPSQNTQTALVAVNPLPGYLAYGQSYYWQVRVWDNQGLNSGWVAGSSFISQPHHYPDPDFTWRPQNPSPEEKVKFTDQTTFYNAFGIVWSWIFEDGDPEIGAGEKPETEFQSQGSKQVSLTVTDSDGFTCSVSKTVRVNLPLPQWKEIKPF